MRILLDEHVPIPAFQVIQHVLSGHTVDHVTKLNKWPGKRDEFLYLDAAKRGYDVVVTNDRSQMADPDECSAVRRSRIHRIGYAQRDKGMRGLGAAVASLLAALPDAVEELAKEAGQRLVTVEGINIKRKRYKIVDPRVEPPRYWPR